MMKNFKYGWSSLLLLFILVPLLFRLSSLIPVPMLYTGIVQDLVVLIVIGLLNHYLFQIPIHWWHGQKIGNQLVQLIPGLILLVLPIFASHLKLFTLPFSGTLMLYVGYVFLIGLTEEYVFRGIMLPILGHLLPNRQMLVICLDSIFFGLFHLIVNSGSLTLSYVIPQMFIAAVSGLLFCGIYLRTNNLLWAILLHAFSDMNLVINLTDHAHTANQLEIPTTIAVSMSVISIIAFIAVAFLVRWQVKNVTFKQQQLL